MSAVQYVLLQERDTELGESTAFIASSKQPYPLSQREESSHSLRLLIDKRLGSERSPPLLATKRALLTSASLMLEV